MPSFQTHTHGKLLLTAEYLVLDGALALALPTRLGQHLTVREIETKKTGTIQWESLDEQGNPWFEALFQVAPLKILDSTDKTTAQRLVQIFQAIQQQKKTWQDLPALHIQTRLDFPRQWGLGTSSTLLAALAQWQQVDPYQLLWDTFGGSAYDIACANAQGPILYQLQAGKPIVQSCSFHPPFIDQLYLVYAGQKQDSREGIRRYKTQVSASSSLVQEMTELTSAILQAPNLPTFEQLIAKHESIISSALDFPTVQQLHFEDFWGQTKSLGAWGGDFMLATSRKTKAETMTYFRGKGFSTIFSFSDWVMGY
ncbi:MAG: GYDIA family GHMP kinase [Saprospiraceae bacterium]